VFAIMGEALNSQTETTEMLERTAEVLVAEFDLKACHFRLLSRDRKVLENIASYGLSERFLAKGPVDAERSVTRALEGEIVMVNDCAVDDRIQYPEEMKREGIVSMLTLPLVVRGQVIGVMRLATSDYRIFDEDEIEFFRVAALYCASAIIHSLFHEILEDVNEAISGNLNLDQVLDAIVEVVADRLRAKGCSIRLLDAKGGILQLKASCGLSRRYTRTVSAHPGRCVDEALEGRCVAIYDAASDERVRHQGEVEREGISSVLLVPVICRDSTLGVLSLYTHRPYHFSDEEIQLMKAVGGQCALAIRNAQMYTALKKRYDAATTDFQEWFDRFGVYGTRPGGLAPPVNEH
jgi:GAF domain-containing protein